MIHKDKLETRIRKNYQLQTSRLPDVRSSDGDSECNHLLNNRRSERKEDGERRVDNDRDAS